MSYDNTNRGTLGKNKRREKDSHPEYTGKLNIEGREFWLSAWVKEARGEKFFSLSVKPVEDATRREQVVRETRGSKPVDLDDTIPFMPDRH